LRKGEDMAEKQVNVTMRGNPVTLEGSLPKIGEMAPDFTAIKNDLSPARLSDFKGKVCIISSVPSLDTPVCDLETRRFNQEAGGLGDKVAILTISMDLPFAQARWCGAAGVDKVITLSDHRDASFGQAYGVLIKGLRLLARCLFVVDKEGVLRYVQLVKEISQEPDYAEVLNSVRSLI